MSSVDKTTNYNLNKWTGTESPKRQDFLDDNNAIEAALTDLSGVITADGTGTAITLAIPSLESNRTGFKGTFIAKLSNASAATTIKINTFTAKPFYKTGTTNAPNLIAGKAYDFWDGGTAFFLKASAEGDAVASHVLAGKKFSNDEDTGLVGTMVDRGSVGTITLGNEGSEYTIAQGYHNGLGKVKAAIIGLIAGVIKVGVNVGGIIGTFTSDATAVAANIIAGTTAYVNGAKITGTMPTHIGTHIVSPTVDGTSVIQRLYMKVPAGYHDGGSYVYGDDPDYHPANFRADVNMFGRQGTMPVRTNSDTGGTYPLCTNDSIYDGVIHLMPPAGYYDGNVWLRDLIPNLQAANIRAGVVIGVGSGGKIVGTLVEGKKYASGSVNLTTQGFTIGGLDFTPSTVHVTRYGTTPSGPGDWGSVGKWAHYAKTTKPNTPPKTITSIVHENQSNIMGAATEDITITSDGFSISMWSFLSITNGMAYWYAYE